MGRRGRPRKQGKRYRSGDLVAAQRATDVRNVVCEQPHRRGLAEDQRRDQRAESEIGRMFLRGELSQDKYWAAERWRGVVREFHVVLATPMQHSSALASMVAPGIEQSEEAGGLAAERPETEAEKRDRVLKVHGAAVRAVRSLAEPHVVFAVLESVVIEDRPCADADRAHLTSGLSALCRLWRMADLPADREPDVRVAGVRADRPSWSHDQKEVQIIYAGD